MSLCHTPLGVNIPDAYGDVDGHLKSCVQGERRFWTLANKLSDAAQRGKLQSERVNAGTMLFEPEACENSWVLAQLCIDDSLPSQVFLAVISAHVVFAVSPYLVSFEDRFMVVRRDVACAAETEQLVAHDACWNLWYGRRSIFFGSVDQTRGRVRQILTSVI